MASADREPPTRVWAAQFANAVGSGWLIREPDQIWGRVLAGRAEADPGMPLNELRRETLREITFRGDVLLVELSGPMLISRRALKERELVVCIAGELEVVEEGRGRRTRRPVGDVAGEEAFRSHSGRRLQSIWVQSPHATVLVVRPSILGRLSEAAHGDLLDQCLRALSDHSQDPGDDDDQGFDDRRAA